jgi:hypothetical protein
MQPRCDVLLKCIVRDHDRDRVTVTGYLIQQRGKPRLVRPVLFWKTCSRDRVTVTVYVLTRTWFF